MELVVGRDLLDDLAIRHFKQHKVAQVIQQQRGRKEAAHHLLQLIGQQRTVVLVLHRAPGQKTLKTGRERTHPGLQTIARHQRRVVNEQVA